LIFKNKTSLVNPRKYKKARDRGATLSRPMILNQLDAVGSDMAWYVNVYRNQHSIFAIDELKANVAIMAGLVDALEEQHIVR
jgi:hypothetical protein